MLSFAFKRFDRVVPEPGNPSRSSAKGLDNEDRALLAQVEAGFETVGESYNACRFRAALNTALALDCEALTRSVSPGSRSRRTRPRQRRACTSSYGSLTT
jgi:hypothetical protein